ncbi:unnamed protein product, partial [Effrenium voratum]
FLLSSDYVVHGCRGQDLRTGRCQPHVHSERGSSLPSQPRVVLCACCHADHNLDPSL